MLRDQYADIGMSAAISGFVRRSFFQKVLYGMGVADGGSTRLATQFLPNAEDDCVEPYAECKEAVDAIKAARSHTGKIEVVDK